ncbi:hypothetical protein [Chryseobacterium sp. ISL-6]|uniref:hypothetical protein n=1 Tax=Chryseobacterium sp. ISL-6 TaxID=2819143 RepID=UPI001BEA65E6|nr:hypothetical protein [Chryseobacterium sp. ISL-6]MBT2622248.1 hypothetical protein [Chryseobacterium sp. ISL-6]
MDFNNIYFKDQYLNIENSFMLEKIDITSFDDIIISHEFPTRKYKLYMFFTQPVKYEPRKGFINKLICAIFNHNNNPKEIKRSYYDTSVEKLLPMIKQCLPEANIPDLRNSVFWGTEDEKNGFQRTLHIYSRDKLSLTDVFKKHNMMRK